MSVLLSLLPQTALTLCVVCGSRQKSLTNHLAHPANTACKLEFHERMRQVASAAAGVADDNVGGVGPDDGLFSAAGDASSSALWDDSCRESVLGDLTTLRFGKHIPEATIGPMKEMVKKWVANSTKRTVEQVRETRGEACANQVAALLNTNFNFFNNIETEKKELAALKRSSLHYVEPVVRWLEVGSPKSRVADLPFVDTLTRLLVHNKTVRTQFFASSDLYKSGSLRQPQTVIRDIAQGKALRNHPLTERSTNRKELRFGVVMSYDDLEVCNPLGVAAGKHNLSCFYAAFTNIRGKERFHHDNMLLLTMAHEYNMKKYSATRVLAGADPVTGEAGEDDWSSFGAQMRALKDGVAITARLTPLHNTHAPRLLLYFSRA
jgi:hypothetical protein